MQNKNPILVLTGAAIVAAAAVAGITRDKWMGTETPAVTAPETAQVTEQPATPPAPAAATATTAAEQPAAATTAEEKPAEQPAAAATTTTEQPAAAPETTTAAAQPEAPAAAAAPETAAAPQPEPASNAPAEPEVPTFDTVNIQKTGEAVIAGRAEPGADVIVKLNGQEIGKTTANADGAFVVVPEQPLPAGSGALTIEAKAQGAASPTASKQNVAVIIPAGQPEQALVAVVSPDAPTKVLQKPAPDAAAEKPAKLVSLDAVDYDTNGNIVFSGQGDAGHTARVYVDNTMIGDAAVGADGRWSFSGTASIAPGNHTLRVDGLDGEGKVVNRVEVPFFREEQSKVAEVAPVEAPAAAPEAAAPAAQPAAEETQQQAAAEQPDAQPAPEAAAPATATEQAAAPAAPKEGRVVIQPGNNLWRISRVLYGTGAKYTMLYEANKDQIRNPDKIYPGQIFKTPEVAPKSETIDPNRRDPLQPEENGGAAQ